ncbi:pilus assembly protein PilM [bacterium]|nr:pilus assembly protein PilM [bacterium]
MIVIEFQDSFCRIFHWQEARGDHALRNVLVVPQEKYEALSGEKTHSAAAVQRNGSAIRQALKTINTKTREALVVIPKQWVTLRIVTLPSDDPAELAEMAQFEAERHIPFNVERHIVSHHILRREGLKGSQVLFAAVDGPRAQDIIDLLNSAGVRVTSLEVSTTVLANALRHSGAWNPETHPTVIHINIGHAATDLTVLHEGLPIFPRSVPLGIDKLMAADGAQPFSPTLDDLKKIRLLGEEENGQAAEVHDLDVEEKAAPALPSGAKWANSLVKAISQTHDFARRESECERISQVFISGIGAHLPDLARLFNDRLGTEPVELKAFAEGLEVDEAANLEFPPSAYVMGAGAVAREIDSDAIRINLLPPSYLLRRVQARRHRSLAMTAALAILVIVVIALYAFQFLAMKERELTEVQKVLRKSSQREKEVLYRKNVVTILARHASAEGSALAILNDMSGWQDLFNSGDMRVTVRSFGYAADSGLKIEGSALSYEDLNRFTSRLEESGHFNSVMIQSTRVEDRPLPTGVKPVGFTVQCFFTPQQEKRR